MSESLLFSLVIFAVALPAGVLPLVTRWSDRALHLFIAFSCGVFLGAVFLHLLPDLAETAALAAEQGGEEHHSTTLWFFVLVGVLLVYFLESLLIRGAHPQAEHQHTVVSYAAFIGLGVHALTAGFGLAVVIRDGQMAWPLFLSMAIHKGAEAFSLGTVFVLSSFRKRKILGFLLVFAATTPIGVIVGDALLRSVGGTSFGVLTALAAGTFLYVSLCELLPEVFHHRVDVGWKILLLSLGVGVVYSLHTFVE